MFTENTGLIENETDVFVETEDVDLKDSFRFKVVSIDKRFVQPENLHISIRDSTLLCWYEMDMAPRTNDEQIHFVELNLNTGYPVIMKAFPGFSNELTRYFRAYSLSDGSFALFGRHYNISVQDKRAGAPNYRFCITRFDPIKETCKTHFISSDDRFASGVNCSIIGDSLWCAYFTSAKNKTLRDRIHFSVYRISKDTSFEVDSFLLEGSGLPKYSLTFNKFFNEYRNLWVDGMVSREDGFDVFVEFFSTTTGSYSSSSTTTTYYFGPMSILHLNGNQLDTICLLNKDQLTEMDRGLFSTYKVFSYKNDYLILFNELHNPEKRKNFLRHYRTLTTQSNLIINRVDPKRKKVVTSVIRNNKKDNRMPVVSETLKSGNELVFLLYRKKHFSLMCYSLN